MVLCMTSQHILEIWKMTLPLKVYQWFKNLCCWTKLNVRRFPRINCVSLPYMIKCQEHSLTFKLMLSTWLTLWIFHSNVILLSYNGTWRNLLKTELLESQIGVRSWRMVSCMLLCWRLEVLKIVWFPISDGNNTHIVVLLLETIHWNCRCFGRSYNTHWDGINMTPCGVISVWCRVLVTGSL